MRSSLMLSLLLLAVGSSLAARHADLGFRPQDRSVPSHRNSCADVIPTATLQTAAPMKLDNRDTDTVTITTIGATRYDYQANGSQSKMLAVSSDGTVHGVFMGGTDLDSNRRVKVWCVDTNGSLESPVNMLNTKTGYPTIDVTGASPTNGMAPNSSVPACHNDNFPWIGTDFGGCTMAFNNLSLPCGSNIYWPHVAVDSQDRIHVVCYEEEGPERYYVRSSNGTAWDAGGCSIISSTSESLGSIVTASATTDKVAVLTFRTFYLPFDGGGEHVGSQMHHDIYLYESENGDIADEIADGNERNLTRFRQQGCTTPFALTGSSYCSMDAIYDHTAEANLHLVFDCATDFTDSLHLIWDLSGEEADSLMNTYVNWGLGRNQLLHHNVDTGSWSLITGSAAKVNPADQDTLDIGRPDAWRQKIDRPSLGVDPNTGYLYCMWSQAWYADTSAAGICNRDVLVACSADNGETWGEAVNITASSSQGCEANCHSEDWPCMAEVVDGYLHIQWIHDLDAGSVIEDNVIETVNDVEYAKVSVDEIIPYEGSVDDWSAEDRVGLLHDTRWYRWYPTAWCGDGETPGIMDTLLWVEPILLLNETPHAVQLDSIAYVCHPDDAIGVGNLDLMQAYVKMSNGYIPVGGWSGTLPPYSSTKFESHLHYNGLPSHDQLLGFFFTGRPDVFYRIEYKEALNAGDVPCLDIEPLLPELIDQYETYGMFDVAVSHPKQPCAFELKQNHPNPFNPVTQIEFVLAQAAEVRLAIYNLQGQLLEVLLDGQQTAGSHSIAFDGSSYSSGVYLYRLESPAGSSTKKMVLVK